MTTTAEAYGFGARAPYATPRASEHDMKERVRLSGLFPRVGNEPVSKQLQGLLKEFEQNAALTGILERRRRLEERTQYELQGREGIDALNRNLAPPLRAGMAGAATSAQVAAQIAGLPAGLPPAPDAAAVMAGPPGVAAVAPPRPRESRESREERAARLDAKVSAAAARLERAAGGGSSGSGAPAAAPGTPSRPRLRSNSRPKA